MDASGNIIRTIKEAPQQTYIAPAPTTQTQTTGELANTTVQIINVNITTAKTSVKIEWETSKPTESKIFIFGGNLSPNVFKSESGFSTRHTVVVDRLSMVNNTVYSYEIEAIEAIASKFAKKTGTFKMLSRPYLDILGDIKIRINLNSQLSCYELGFTSDEILVCLNYKNPYQDIIIM